MPKKKYKYLVGIDEAGRGPLAGPVAVAAVKVPRKKAKQVSSILVKFNDSKKLTHLKREWWFKKIKEMQTQGMIDFTVSFSSARTIDGRGIVYGIQSALKRSLRRLCVDPDETYILLDGSLSAPHVYMYQETIIKGDEKEKIIAVASIIAKVLRDRRMITYERKFQNYGFEQHKGYGTRAHYRAIAKCGLCEIHRRSFVKYL